MRLYRYVGTSRDLSGKVYVRVQPSDPSRIHVRQELTVIREACFLVGVPKALFHVYGESRSKMVNFALDDMEELSEEEATAILVLNS